MMKRRAFKLLLFLLAGAIINVAVAWGCANWSKFDTESRVSLIADEQAILDKAGEVYRLEITFFERTGAGIKQRSVPLEDSLELDLNRARIHAMREQGARMPGTMHIEQPLAFLHRLEAGWPIRSLETRLWDHSLNWLDTNGLAVTASPFRIESGIFIGTPLPEGHSFGMRLDEQHRILPLRPIWPGFAINTIFYAAALWLLFVAPFALRRRIRIKRGQCASCGYSLQGGRGTPHVEKCPECGSLVSSSHPDGAQGM